MNLNTMKTLVVYQDFQTWKTAVQAAGLRTWMYADTENGPSEDDMTDPCFAIDPTTARYPEDCDVLGIWRCEWHENPQSHDDCDRRGYLFRTHDEYMQWCMEEYGRDQEAYMG